MQGPSDRSRPPSGGGKRSRDGDPPESETTGAASSRAAKGLAKPPSDTSQDHRQSRTKPNSTRRQSRRKLASEHAPTQAYGALDLGTNNCRLLVARPSRRGFFVVDAFSRIIRLGEGVSRTGKLSEAAIERTIEALQVCADKLHRHQVSRARLIATEACRIAGNGDEFLARVKARTGLSLEIVSRETEAKLAVSGCASLIDPKSELALVFDIGGGSTEIIWLDLSKRGHTWKRSLHDRLDAQNCIAAWTSLPVGVVTLAEQFGGCEVGRHEFEQMVEHVSTHLHIFEDEHGFVDRLSKARAHLLGTSGTVTTVAGIHLGLPRYDRSRVDGSWLKLEDVRSVSDRLLGCSYEQRIAEPCVGRDRADLVLAGCAIVEALTRMWTCKWLRVADRGLREGILATLMAEDGHYKRQKKRNGRGQGKTPSAT